MFYHLKQINACQKFYFNLIQNNINLYLQTLIKQGNAS